MMAVTFDAPSGNFCKSGASTTGLSFVSNVGDTAGTVGNNPNRVLIGGAVFSRGQAALDPVVMTATGKTMTQLAKVDIGGGGGGSVYFFGLINPATGNQTLSVSFAGGLSTAIYLGAISVYNADQTTGWRNVSVNTGNSSTPSSTVNSALGNMAIALHGDLNASTPLSITAPAAGWIDSLVTNNAMEAYLASTASVTTINFSMGSSVLWSHASLDVLPAAGGGLFMPTNPLTGLGVGGHFFANPMGG